jgi:hypothetical protein
VSWHISENMSQPYFMGQYAHRSLTLDPSCESSPYPSLFSAK